MTKPGKKKFVSLPVDAWATAPAPPTGTETCSFVHRPDLLTDVVSLDCEMVEAHFKTSGPLPVKVLGRVSLINYNGMIVYDAYVHHQKSVDLTSTNQPFSGILWTDLHRETGARAFQKKKYNKRYLLSSTAALSSVTVCTTTSGFCR